MKATQRIAGLRAQALDFAPGLLRVQHQPPAPLPRVVLLAVLVLFSVLLIWAAFGRLDVIAVAHGKLVPLSYLKIVQPTEPGVVQEILVGEGQAVQAGQVLMRMNPVLHQADSKTLQGELAEKGLRLRRVDAELTGTPLRAQTGDNEELFRQVQAQLLANQRAYQDALSQERAVLTKAVEDLAAASEILEKLRLTLPMYQANEAALAKLAKEGYAGNLVALDRQRLRIEREQELRAQEFTVKGLQATIARSERRLQEITSSYRQLLQKERVETFAEYQRLEQQWAKQEHRNNLLELRAPQAGIVKDLATHTPGTVVSPGDILMTLVPNDEKLRAEVWISNEDAGFVHPDLPVKTKVISFPFQKYGLLDGTVTHVSADASDLNGRGAEVAPRTNDGMPPPLHYKAIVTLNSQVLYRNGEPFKLAPGMQVAAEIVLGERTVLEYLLSPVQKAFTESARER